MNLEMALRIYREVLVERSKVNNITCVKNRYMSIRPDYRPTYNYIAFLWDISWSIWNSCIEIIIIFIPDIFGGRSRIVFRTYTFFIVLVVQIHTLESIPIIPINTSAVPFVKKSSYSHILFILLLSIYFNYKQIFHLNVLAFVEIYGISKVNFP